MGILSAVGESLRYRGLLGTLGAGARVVAHPILKREAFRIYEERRFDRRYGVDTAGTLQPHELDIAPAAAAVTHRYEGVRPREIRDVISCLRIAYREFTFVDIGCGKGRALLVASDFPFKRIIGVELSAALTRVAQDNLHRYHRRRQRCRDLSAVCADATRYVLPSGPLVLYLYNPFDAPVMEVFLARIERALASEPRPMVMVYLNPTCDALLATASFLANTRRRSSYAVYRSR
jgi:SAM-dependent methyltransferase